MMSQMPNLQSEFGNFCSILSYSIQCLHMCRNCSTVCNDLIVLWYTQRMSIMAIQLLIRMFAELNRIFRFAAQKTSADRDAFVQEMRLLLPVDAQV